MEKNRESNEDVYDEIYACSTTDCTGLIPALPKNDEELEAYEELYHYLPKTYMKEEKEDR